MQKKKLLGSALALAMVFPSSQASAELLKNLKWEGSFEFAGVSADNVTDFLEGDDQNATNGTDNGRDRIGSMQHRILVGLGFDLLDDVHSKVTLHKNNRVYGNTAQTLNGVQDTVELQEANVKVDKLMGAVDMTLGRQFVGNQGDLVAYFGPRNDYGLNTDALDAARFDWAGEMVGVTALAGKLQGNTGDLTPAQNGDTDIRALMVSMKGHENVSAGAYLWNALGRRYNAGVGVGPTTVNAGGRNQRLYVAGLKGKLMMGGLWAGAEFAKNFGDQRQTETATTAGSRKFTGWALLADAGAKIDIDGLAAFTPWGQFGVGSGDTNSKDNENMGFQSINTDYRPGALYGRFHSASDAALAIDETPDFSATGAASNGLSNRVIWGVGLKATPAAASKLTLGASFWDIRFHRATAAGTTAAAFDGAKTIGREIDLEANWAHSDNVSLTGTLAKFIPGQALKNTAQSTNASNASAGSGRGINDAWMAAFDVRVKWGGQQ